MKIVRVFGWVIIALNVYMVGSFFKNVFDLTNSGSSDTSIGIFFFLSLIIWAVINVPLYIIYRVTGSKQRLCPACGLRVKPGKLLCPACGFDFFKNAEGMKPTE